MLRPPSRSTGRRAYLRLQEMLSVLDASFAENLRFITHQAARLCGSPAAAYTRVRPSGSPHSIASLHGLDRQLVGEVLPDGCEGQAVGEWIGARTGHAHSISLPVRLKDRIAGWLVVLSTEERELTLEEYDSLEALVLACSWSEVRQGAYDVMLYHGRLRNALVSISRQLSREESREEMLVNVCRDLVDRQGVYNAWIALLDEEGCYEGKAFQAGFGEEQFARITEDLERGRLPDCASLAVSSPGTNVVQTPSTSCSACPLSKGHECRSGLSVRIVFDSRTYGWLTVSVSGEFRADHVEHAVLAELAEAIGMSLNAIETDRRHRRAEARRRDMLQRFERLSAFRLQLVKMMKSSPVGAILRETVDEAERWTGSTIGFFHFFDEGRDSIHLQAWSTRTTETMCRVEGSPGHYELDRAGIWADAVRKKHVVIHNDYPAAPDRHGLPEGHAGILRELVVPIVRDGEVKAVLGIGNKPEPYDDEDARWIGVLADQTWDIIENKLYMEQQASMQFQLEHAKKMEMVGTLAAGITHEINNPLNYLSLNVSNLQHDYAGLSELVAMYRSLLERAEADGRHPELAASIRSMEQAFDIEGLMADLPGLLESTRSGVARITGITRSMRNLSFRNMTDARTLSDLNKVIRDAVVIAAMESREVATITPELGELPMVSCNPPQVSQVVLNLLMNSLQAIRGEERSAPGTVVVRSWADAKNVYCSVADDGPGIDPGIRDGVFTPFVTTKERGIGSGLGLSIAFDIVTKRHGGSLSFACPPEGGTVFTMALPL